MKGEGKWRQQLQTALVRSFIVKGSKWEYEDIARFFYFLSCGSNNGNVDGPGNDPPAREKLQEQQGGGSLLNQSPRGGIKGAGGQD